MEVNLARRAKNECFHRCDSQKRNVRGSTALMSTTGKLAKTNKEKAVLQQLFLPQSSLATSLPTPLGWMHHKMGTEAEKSLLPL